MKRLLSLITALTILAAAPAAMAQDPLNCWFPPGWKAKPNDARAITAALSEGSGITIRPRIAQSYPQILSAFDSGEPSLVYVGSFVQAILHARGLGEGLVQSVNGKEFYSGVLIYPKGEDPRTLVANSPEAIAFATGASSGESSAKAATGGKASIAVKNHNAAAGAVKIGKAKAAVVKNWWWDANSARFAELEMHRLPGVSEERNPDNVLSASKSVPPEVRAKIAEAAMANKDVFKAREVIPFDQSRLEFSLSLMRQGRIDPLTYAW